ncbi:MAG: hypothetical protein K0S44_1779, partial [Bacteroidetes bacterium]|nr:hypothetical protein [Bacteroidota bacterium]
MVLYPFINRLFGGGWLLYLIFLLSFNFKKSAISYWYTICKLLSVKNNLLKIPDMNCLIVDDNKMARTALKKLTDQVDFLSVKEECSTPVDA